MKTVIVPVSQTRAVAGTADGNDKSDSDFDSDSDAAVDFTPFASGASASVTLLDTDASATGSSVFDVTFDVSTAADFNLSGALGAFDNGDVSLTFNGPSGEGWTIEVAA